MKLENIISASDSKKVYRDGDKTIKVFDSDYSKADVLNEALNQARVEETEINIPKILPARRCPNLWMSTPRSFRSTSISS